VNICNKCNVELTDDNWYSSYKKWNKKQCISCARYYGKNNYYNRSKEQKEKYTIRMKEYNRKYTLCSTNSNGDRIVLKIIKRPHTLTCELCNKEVKKTVYHHWDDEHPEFGIWVCGWCHQTVEIIEKIPDIKEKYNQLKQNIMEGL